LRINNILVVFKTPTEAGVQPEFIGSTRLDELNISIVSRFVFHPDGNRLAVHQNGQIVLLDVDDLAPAGVISAPPGFTGFAFSPDGKQVAIGGEQIQIRAVETGNELERITVEYDPDEIPTVGEVAFSLDGSQLLADTTNGSRVFETARWTLAAKIAGPYLAFGWHGLSPDGSLLVAPDKDGELVFRQPSDGAGLASQDGSEKRGYSPVFSPDGALLATWSTDGAIWLWGLLK
jgi:WD40 repeat protein